MAKLASAFLFLSLFAFNFVSAETKVLAISGSLREDSVNKKLVKDAAQMASDLGAKVTVVDLRDYPMPFYNGDLEANEGMPEKARKFRQLMVQSDVILIASPEYNGSISGVLKNALDWSSRSEDGKSSREAFKGKTFALMGASPGKGGGARGLVHLAAVIQDVGGTVLPEKVTVPNASSAFDAQGHLKDSAKQQELKQLVQTAVKG